MAKLIKRLTSSQVPLSSNAVSVLICAHTEERFDALMSAISSVKAQTVLPLETIVVIDHNPALLERVRLACKGVWVVENTSQRGLSGARNTGIGLALGDIVAFLDDDAVAERNWLKTMLTWYSNPKIMGVGGAITPYWITKEPSWFPSEFNWVVGCTYKGMPEKAAPIRNLIGCNMSFRSEVFEKVGGFRSDLGRIGKYPAGCEETELCIRAAQRWPNKQLIYEPDAKVAHLVPDTRAKFAYYRARCYAEGLSKALVAKHVGEQDGLASERRYVSSVLPMGVLKGLISALKSGKVAGAAQALAIIAGFCLTLAGYTSGILHQKVAGRPITRKSAQKTNVLAENRM